MEEYLTVLNEQQREAVVHEGSPLLILAGAGSGKTRVITTKIAYLINQKNVEPYSILAVTFTKKAAAEMKQRAAAIEPRSEGSQIRTFHSFGSWFLRKYSDEAGLEKNFTVYDDDDMAVLVRKADPSLSTKEAKIAAKQISLAKDYCLLPEDDLSFLQSEFDINTIYSEYQKKLRACGNVDFGDLIMLPYLVMQKEPMVARQIHNRFKVIMVDEYQDSNIAQYKLLQKLSGVEEGNDCYVCVVGDDDQSIYHFRGAEVQNILSFSDKFPGTQIIRLERNYRSTSKILEAASLVVSKNENRLGKTLVAERSGGGSPVLAFLPGYEDEGPFCSSLIKKSIKDGACYSDWAIMYRTNAQSLNFEKAFVKNKIPYVVVGSLKFFEREEIKDALAYISLFSNPRDEVSFRRIINKPSRGIGEKTQDKLLALSEKTLTDENGQTVVTYNNLLESMAENKDCVSKKAAEGIDCFVRLYEGAAKILEEKEEKKLSDLLKYFIEGSELDKHHRAGDEVEGTTRELNLQELVNNAAGYECSLTGLTEFLDSINRDRTLEKSDEQLPDDAVTLITLHNTKGLEYNRVIITGLEDGIFPRNDKTGDSLEEERRLFYVGITRAKDELYITSCAQRYLYGSLQYSVPSKFIKDFDESLFTIIGNPPSSKMNGGFYGGYGYGYGSGREEYSDYGDKAALAKKWCKGTQIYHDEYGYGRIINTELTGDDELIIEVQFENNLTKKFLPEYQAKNLEIIK
ncbi:MAG: UvrD-helicase domain-containing protein [Treponema sp.]|nr:UvrD-helicase domain-containing protein [Treponema sp.]